MPQSLELSQDGCEGTSNGHWEVTVRKSSSRCNAEPIPLRKWKSGYDRDERDDVRTRSNGRNPLRRSVVGRQLMHRRWIQTKRYPDRTSFGTLSSLDLPSSGPNLCRTDPGRYEKPIHSVLVALALTQLLDFESRRVLGMFQRKYVNLLEHLLDEGINNWEYWLVAGGSWAVHFFQGLWKQGIKRIDKFQRSKSWFASSRWDNILTPCLLLSLPPPTYLCSIFRCKY
jgi:hypothetical protein